MIVRDETPVIERCLASVKDVIDYYIISDTGSTDGTQKLIKDTMDGYGIPGEVIEDEWVNFQHNRNLALQHAYANKNIDYVLFIDADEILHYDNPDSIRNTVADMHCLDKSYGPLRYRIPFMVNIRTKEWKWNGVIHEYIAPIEPPVEQSLCNKNCWILATPGEGVRSRGITQEEKFLKDAKVLQEEYEKNPDDLRTIFYLAQSYRDAKELEKAIKYYGVRADLDGWPEEKYYAQYQKGKLMLHCDKFTFEEARAELMKACELRPNRAAEPLYELIMHQRSNKSFTSGCFFGQAAMAFLGYPINDTLFVDKMIYDWKLKDELAMCFFYANQPQQTAKLLDELIRRQDLPPVIRQRVVVNMGLALERIPSLVGLPQ
jgi:tetratricopeptide (TPR) repeat protein